MHCKRLFVSLALINKLPMFKHCQTYDLRNANDLAYRLVNIPSSTLKSNYQ